MRRAGDRYVTEAEGRTTFHSFAFGPHYDPANLAFGAITAYNDENLPPGTGYAPHPHAEVEIVTWVLEGALRHTDDTGASRVLLPGDVQRTSAGTGIVHSEMAEPGVPTRFLQTWLRPDVYGVVPSTALATGLTGTGLTAVEGLGIGVAGARLYLGSPTAGSLVLPDADRLHVFVATGRLAAGDRELGPGDVGRLVGEGGRSLSVVEAGTVAVWAV